MLRKILIVVVMLISGFAVQATTRRVLFLGNSYIYTNNLPLLIQQIAFSMGDTLIYDENNVGGYTMQDHSTTPKSITKIYAQAWDVVVLQEQSQRTAFSPSQVAANTYPYARKLDSLVRDHRACTETMFFMTWGYKNGDAGNCAVYPPICTYQGMQQRIRESYLQMAMDNNAIVSPVGAAWRQVRDSFPGIELYSPDESHPAAEGSYLAACVFYASIFHKNPAKTTVTGGIAVADAAKLSRIAGKVVLDSFNTWNQYGNYTYANFTKSLAGNVATFTNTSVKATNYNWTFGNGNNSTTPSPTQTYAPNGAYLVTLTASNSCFTESRSDSVITRVTGIPKTMLNDDIKVYAAGDGRLRITNTGTNACAVDIIDMNGRLMEHRNIPANATEEKLVVPGTYVCRWYTTTDVISRRVQVY